VTAMAKAEDQLMEWGMDVLMLHDPKRVEAENPQLGLRKELEGLRKAFSDRRDK
jgi:hypothetical protein